MKAMVLAAGLGTRMRPLSQLVAKPVMPVLNRPLLHWTLELLGRHGVTEVVVNLHHLPGTVKKALSHGNDFGLRVRFSMEPEILGTGGGPRKVRRLLGDDPVLLVNGDALFDFDLTSLLHRHRASGARATLALKPNVDPRRYAPVITGPRGRVLALPGHEPRATGTVSMFTGVHVLDPALLDRLPAGPSDSVRDIYARVVAQGGLVQGVRVAGFWYDLGTPELYRKAQVALLRRGKLVPAARALVHETATVHPRAEITGSVVGPGCVVGEGAVVERSVLWERATIGPRATVVDCVVATSAHVPGGASLRSAVRMPADRSRPLARVKRHPGRA